MADKIKKKFKHIAVGEDVFNRFRDISPKMTDEEILQMLLNQKEQKE